MMRQRQAVAASSALPTSEGERGKVSHRGREAHVAQPSSAGRRSGEALSLGEQELHDGQTCFEQRQATAASRIGARCGEGDLHAWFCAAVVAIMDDHVFYAFKVDLFLV